MKTKSNKILIASLMVLTVVGVAFGFRLALAQSTREINVSAYLVNSENKEITNGEYEVRFALYASDRSVADPYPSTGDARVWEEVQKVKLQDGFLNAYLGAVNPIPANINFSNNVYYLGIRMGEDSEMVPRKRIGAAPLAIDALSVSGSVVGTGAGNIVQLGNGGKIDIGLLPTGTSGKKLVLAQDLPSEHDEVTFSGNYDYLTLSGQEITLGQINLNTDVSGNLSIARGGTGLNSFTKGDLTYYDSGSSLSKISIGAEGQVLTVNGGIPVWKNQTGTLNGLGVAGHMTFWTDTDEISYDNNGNFYWDAVNNRLGIGTVVPSKTLDVVGDITFSGDLTPSNANQSIGEMFNRFEYGYFENLDVTNLNIAGVDISGTVSNVLTLNSDNVTNDTEDSYLAFDRGENGGVQNSPASIQWNSTDDTFELNFPLNVNGVITATGGTSTNWNTAYTHSGLTSNVHGLTFTAEGSGGGLDADFLDGHDTSYFQIAGSYLTTETDPIFSASAAAGITGTNISNWNTAYGWGDHAAEGYITLTDISSTATGITYTNTTGVFSLTSGYVIPTTTEETNWNTAYTNRVDTWNYPFSISSNAVSFGYNTTNLQLTANQLNTIQNINSTATPTFQTLTLGYNGADGYLTLYSEQGVTDYSTIFQPGTQTQNIVYTLPNNDGDSDQILASDGNGVLTWRTVTGIGGAGDITAIGDVASGDAFTSGGTSGTSLYFANSTFHGQLTVGTLTSDKTYTLPDVSGTFITTGDTGTVTGTMIADNTILEIDLVASNTPSDGQVLVYNNATGGFSWSSAGSGGIGDITAIGDVTSGDAFTSAGTSGTSLYFYDADGRGQLTIANLTAARTYTLPDASGTFTFGTGAAGYVPYWSDANSLSYDSDGYLYWNSISNRLGIGTTSPGAILDIQASEASQQLKSTTGTSSAYTNYVNTGGTFRVGQDRNTGGGLLTNSASYAGVMAHIGNYPLQFGTNNVVRMTVSSGGYVGIGTTSPGAILDIQASEASQQLESTTGTSSAYTNYVNTGGTFRVGQDRNTGGGLLTNSASYAGVMAHIGNYPLQFGTNNVVRMTVSSGGYVGIGTTAPGTALDVNGVITATGGTSTNWNTAYGWGNHASAGYFVKATDDLDDISTGTTNVHLTTTLKSNYDAAYTYRLTGVTNNATGLTLSLASNNLTAALTSGYVIPTTTQETNWNTAYTHSGLTSNVHGLTFTAEGSGGGLDADLLDGHDTSYFQTALTNPVTGTGTTNYLSKFTGTSAIGNSLVYDNGTNVGIGTTAPSGKLDVITGTARFQLSSFADGGGANEGITLSSSSGSGAAPIVRLNYAENRHWEIGMDSTVVADTTSEFFVGSWNGSSIDDKIRMDMNGKLILGNQIGTPAASTAQLWVTANAGLDAYSGYLNDNSSKGLLISNSNTGNAAGARLEMDADSQGFVLEVFGSGHATYPNQSWFYTTNKGQINIGPVGTNASGITITSGNNPAVGINTGNATIRGILDVGKGTAGLPSGYNTGIAKFRSLDEASLAIGSLSSPTYASWIQSGDSSASSFTSLPLLLQPSGGYVGIGTTAPGTALDVNGVITATGGTSTNWNTAYSHSQATSDVHGLTFTAEGSGGGLDADLLDGHDTTYFQTALTNPVTGTGTTNYLSKFTGTSTIGNSLVYDNGTNVGIGTTAPGMILDVIGNIRASSNIYSTYVNGSYFLDDTNNYWYLSTNHFTYGSNFVAGWASSATVTLASTAPDIGMSRLSANKMAIGNGTQGDYTGILIAGNIGIGTTNPTYNLDVTGTGRFTSTDNPGLLIGDGTTGYLGIGNATISKAGGALTFSSSGYFSYANATTNTVANVLTLNRGVSGGSGANGVGTGLLFIAEDSAGNAQDTGKISGLLSTATSGLEQSAITFQNIVGGAALSEVMRIDGSNVGIGTTAPGTALDVNGVITATGGTSTNWNSAYTHSGLTSNVHGLTFTAEGTGGGLDADLLDGHEATYFQTALTNPVTGTGTTNYLSKFTGTSAIGNSLVYDNGTNVGIGTTAPGTQLLAGAKILEISSIGAGEIVLDHTDAGAASTLGMISFESNNDHLAHILSYTDGASDSAYLSFHAQATGGSYSSVLSNEKMRITSSGYVGIGTTSPGTKLQIKSGAFQQINSDNYSGIYLDAPATNEPKVGFRASDNSERFRIQFQGVNGDSERLAFIKTRSSEAEVLSVLWSGNVGIGTTAPGTALQVNGVITATGGTSTNWNDAYTYRLTGVTNNATGITASLAANNLTLALTGGYVIPTTTQETNWNTAYTHSGLTSNVHGLTFTAEGTGGGLDADLLDGHEATYFQTALTNPVTGTGTTNYLSKFTGTSAIGNSLIYDNGTNVGIGTTAPTNVLQVKGGLLTTGTTESYAFSAGNSNANDFTIGSDGSFSYLQSWNGKALQINNQGNDTILNPATGNVGIGTTAPEKKLVVLTSSNVDGLLVRRDSIASNDYASMLFGVSTYNTGYMKSGIFFERTGGNGLGSLHLAVNNVSDISNVSIADAKMTILGNGNVGIGTTSPGAKLEINGGAGAVDGLNITNLGTANYGINMTSSGLSGTGDYFFYADSTNYWRADGSAKFNSSVITNSDFSGPRIGASTSAGLRITDDGNNLGIFIQDGGNVGIGTSTPNYKVQIDGSVGLTASGSYRKAITPTYFGYSNSYKVLMLGSASTTYNADDGAVTISFGYDPSSNTNGSFSGTGSELLFRNNVIFKQPNSTDDGYLSPLILDNGSVKFPGSGIWNTSGNVGIGTTAPGTALDVNGVITATGGTSTNWNTAYSHSQATSDVHGLTFTAEGSGGGLDADLLDGHDTTYFQTALTNPVTGTGTTNYLSKFTGTSTIGSSLIYDNGTNVGIGTTAPSQLLEIYGANQTLKVTQDTTSSGGATLWLTAAGAGSDSNAATIKMHSAGSFWSRTDLSGIRFGSADKSSAWGVLGSNVGIGTTSPTQTLEVNGVSRFDNTVYLANGTTYYINSSGTGNLNALTLAGGFTANGAFTLGDNGDTGSVNTSDWDISTTGAMTGISGITNDSIITSTGGIISLNASSNYAVNIATGTSTGAISIGGGSNTVAVSSTSWDVSTAGAFSGITTINMSGQLTSTLATGTSPFAVTSTTVNTNLNADLLDGQHGTYYATAASISGTDNYIPRFNGTSALENSIIYDNGTNVGIGTTAPNANYLLDIVGSARTSGNIVALTGAFVGNGSAGTPSYNFASDTSFDTGIFRAAENMIGFSTAGSERVRIDSSGYVGIGTTSPAATLHVAASSTTAASLTWGATAGTILRSEGSELAMGLLDASPYPYWIQARTSGNTARDIALQPLGGKVGIGTTSPTYTLTVNGGDIYTSGDLRVAGDDLFMATNTSGYLLIADGTNYNPTAMSGDVTITSGGVTAIGANAVTLSTDTTGNYVATITGGSGISSSGATSGEGIAHTLSLGALTANWSQTGAYDIVLGNASSELQIMESTGATYYGIFDVGDLAANQTYTFTTGGTVWTSGNDGSTSTLDADLLDGHDTAYFQTALTNPVTGTGTANYLSKFTGTSAIGNSLVYDNGTNVGIGTTAPGAILHVSQAGTGAPTFERSGASADTVYISQYLLSTKTTSMNDGFGTSLSFLIMDNAAVPNVIANIGAARSGADNSGALIFQTASAGTITEKMRITPGGNVGIGTTAPAELLDVNGRIHLAQTTAPSPTTDRLYNVSGNLTWNGINLTAGGALPVGTEGQLMYSNAGAWTSFSGMLWNDTNSRLGIGTTNPGGKLDLLATSGSQLRLSYSDSVYVDFTVGNTGNLSITSNTAGATTSIGAGTDVAIKVDGSGNVGIGTTNPGSKLSVYGGVAIGTYSNLVSPGDGVIVSGNVGIGTTSPNTNLVVSAAGANGINLGADTGDATLSTRLYISTGTSGQSGVIRNSAGDIIFSTAATVGTDSGTERIRISSAGKVGIGTTAPLNSLDIGNSGGIHIASGIPDSTNYALYNSSGVLTWNGTALGAENATGTSGYISKFGVTNSLGDSIIYESSGKIGIGTTAPGQVLDVAGQITFGTSGNTFSTESDGEPLLAGTARHSRQVSLNAEYSGAVLTAFYGAGTDTSISGTMVSDTEPSTDKLRNYYEWNSSETSLNYYTVAVRVTLPPDFDGWNTSNAVQVDIDSESTSAADNLVDIYIYNGDDTPGTVVASSTSNVSSSADTWSTVSIDDSAVDDASAPDWDANTTPETAVIYLRLGSKDDNFVRIGDIRLNYYSKW